MSDLSLPRHQWTFHQTAFPGVFFWYCSDCWMTVTLPETTPPPPDLCPGPGPHKAEDIAIVRKVLPEFGIKVPEYLRER